MPAGRSRGRIRSRSRSDCPPCSRRGCTRRRRCSWSNRRSRRPRIFRRRRTSPCTGRRRSRTSGPADSAAACSRWAASGILRTSCCRRIRTGSPTTRCSPNDRRARSGRSTGRPCTRSASNRAAPVRTGRRRRSIRSRSRSRWRSRPRRRRWSNATRRGIPRLDSSRGAPGRRASWDRSTGQRGNRWSRRIPPGTRQSLRRSNRRRRGIRS